MTAYYNEHDPYAAQWLRNLIMAGHIAPGEVDERSIRDVSPSDISGYTQCHWFAGIGGWSLALRLAGWPDYRPVWTGSCPCQPFSTAGKKAGFSDDRHLWPELYRLSRECRPATLFGEQVASPDGYAWLDTVCADMEAAGYAVGAAVLPAASVGAPHGRHRIFFVADAEGERRPQGRGWEVLSIAGNSCDALRMADALRAGRPERRPVSAGSTAWGGSALRMADADQPGGWAPGGEQPLCDQRNGCAGSGEYSESEQARVSRFARERRATGGYWADADWLPCQGGKWRPIEPGSFPLAHGVSGRMGKLRAYGNAIVPQAGAAFIGAFLKPSCK